MNFKQTISTKFAIAALLILLLFLADLKFKQWKNQRQIEQQKQSLQQQTDALQKKNDELSQSLDYLNSPTFKESVARQQLGLKKQGEQVYSFSNATQTDQGGQSQTSSNNLKKWWNYFFGS